MAIFSRKAKKVKEVLRFDGAGPKTLAMSVEDRVKKDPRTAPTGASGGEYFNIYVHDDDPETCHTIEFNRFGAHMAEYDGEPDFPEEKEPLAEGTPPKSAPPIPPKPAVK